MSARGPREQLAEMTANAVAAARAKVSLAAGSAEEIDRLLERAEDSLRELPKQAEQIRAAAEFGDRPPFTNTQDYQDDVDRRLGDSRVFFNNAQSFADDVNRRLGHAQGAIREVREYLTDARAPLAHAKSFLDELEDLPDQESTGDGAGEQATTSDGAHPTAGPQVTTATMRERLTRLETAINNATQGVENTANRLHTARTSLQKLRGASVGFENPRRSAALVDYVGQNVTSDIEGLKGGLRDAHLAGYEADQATAKANELAIAVHAGLNPTPRSEQTAPRPAPEDPRRAWSEGRDLGHDINR